MIKSQSTRAVSKPFDEDITDFDDITITKKNVQSVRFTILDDLDQLNQNISRQQQSPTKIEQIHNYNTKQSNKNQFQSTSLISNTLKRAAPKSPITSHAFPQEFRYRTNKSKEKKYQKIGQESKVQKNIEQQSKILYKKSRMYTIQRILDLSKDPQPSLLKELEAKNHSAKNLTVKSELEYEKENKEYNLFSKVIQTQRNKGKKFTRLKK